MEHDRGRWPHLSHQSFHSSHHDNHQFEKENPSHTPQEAIREANETSIRREEEAI